MNEVKLLKTLLQYSSDIVICLNTNFKVQTFNSSAEKFYNLKHEEAIDTDFLEFCKSSNYTSPINANFFDNPTLLNINLDSKNHIGKQCNINWIICPLALTNKSIDAVVIIGKSIELKKK